MILIVLGSIVAILVSILFSIRSTFKPPKGGVVRLLWKDSHQLPSLVSYIPLILAGAIFKNEGRFYPGLKDFPKTHIEIGASEYVHFWLVLCAPLPASPADLLCCCLSSDCRLEVKHIEKYYDVCGFEKPKAGQELTVPPCYPVMSIFNFQPFLVSMPSFPVSPLGVIHVRTVLTQHKVLKAGTKLVYSIDMCGHKDTERGMEVDFVIKASLESGEVVWNCIETMLSRKKGSGGKKKPTPAAAAEGQEPRFDGSVLFPVAENTGRRYASVVGDYNPHHMNKIGAILFGFPKPIAHGQWSLEHSLAQLQAAGIPARPPFKVDCSFKLPIYMPGKCLLRWNTTGAPKHGTVDFELRSADGKLPHLAGKLENLDQPGTLV